MYPTAIWLQVTGQLQEPKDLLRPATVKVVCTILYSPEALLHKYSYSFNPHIRFPVHSAEWTGRLLRPNGALS